MSICTFGVNEAESLKECVKTIADECSLEDIHEILICTCTATTAKCYDAIREITALYPQIHIVPVQQPPEKPYWGGACRTLIDSASGTHILCMSSDLECNPHLVSALIAAEKENPNGFCKASRWLDSSVFDGYGFFRKAGNRLFQSYMNLLFHANLTDYTYCFQIGPTNIFRETHFHKNGKTVPIELIAEPILRKLPIRELPIEWKKREEKPEKKRIQKDLNHLFWYILVSLKIRQNGHT